MSKADAVQADGAHPSPWPVSLPLSQWINKRRVNYGNLSWRALYGPIIGVGLLPMLTHHALPHSPWTLLLPLRVLEQVTATRKGWLSLQQKWAPDQNCGAVQVGFNQPITD